MKTCSLYIIFLLTVFACSSKSENSEKKSSVDAHTKSESPNFDVDPIEVKKNDASIPGDSVESKNESPEKDVESCETPDLKNIDISHIPGFLQFLNLLPKPTSVICVINALPRPFLINATSNKFSGQPAASYQSPRIFIKLGKLIISVVPAGETSYSMELAETYKDLMSIKGDLKFPLTESISPESPFKNIYDKGQYSCAKLCHAKVVDVEKFNSEIVSYASTIIFPRRVNEVAFIDLQLIRDECDNEEIKEKKICRFYKALFDNGEVEYFSYDVDSL